MLVEWIDGEGALSETCALWEPTFGVGLMELTKVARYLAMPMGT